MRRSENKIQFATKMEKDDDDVRMVLFIVHCCGSFRLFVLVIWGVHVLMVF